MIWFYVLIIAGGIAWWLRRSAQAPREESPIARKRVAPGEITFARASGETRLPTPLPQETLLAAFRSDELPAVEGAERDDIMMLQRALSMAADHIGAADVVLWRPDLDDQRRMIAVAGSRGREPEITESERAIIQWSAESGTLGNDAGGEHATRLLVAPVPVNETSGAISAHFSEDPKIGRTLLREWFGRHAIAIATTHDLVRVRAELSRRNFKLRAMIRTAKTLQGSRDPIALEQMLVRDSLIMSIGTWGMLVRWDAHERVGTVKVATDGAPTFGVRVTARRGSLIGDVCDTGVPRVVTDTRVLVQHRDHVFDAAPLPPGTGSLLAVPLRRSEDEPVLGALIVGHTELRALQSNDAHALRELGVIAAGALETAWAHQAETERARTDQLTGLANRRSFEESFARMIGETDRYGGSAALVLCDVDHFKKVNDTYGHETGDQVLVAVANALESGRRTTDAVSRVGGEELALLLFQTDAAGAMEVAERARALIESLAVPTTKGEVRVTASFGVAMYTARSGVGAKLYERADRALYAAKHGGRNRVELAAGEGAWSGT